MARVFKVNFGTGQQTVTPFNQKEADDIRLICKQKYQQASDKIKPNSKNPHWSEKFRWDRNLLLFDLGFNTALRIEDLLQLQVNKQVMKGYIDVHEFKSGRWKDGKYKSGKNRAFQLNKRITAELQNFIERNSLVEGEYLFQSRNGYNMPVTRQQAYNIIQELANELGIIRKVGCHSLRKTFGKLYYEQTNDLAGLHQMIHNGKGDPRVTLIYIGLIQEEVSNKRKEFDI